MLNHIFSVIIEFVIVLGTTVEIESKIAAGSLEILLDSHQVFLGGTEVSLTPMNMTF